MVDIIKHPAVVDGKSTAVHARLLAPDHVKIYTYPNIPNFENKEKVILFLLSKYFSNRFCVSLGLEMPTGPPARVH